ncbi:MAG: CaiB/BaiF CoA-transferase family protein [Pseudomonadota bacterium]
MKPLEGIKVVDFTRVLAGPTCTRVLVELGATVTKIEPPAGDVARNAGPFVDDECGYFLQLNGGKRNISIDLNYPEARDIVFGLCARADVIVENFRPGTMRSFGLEYARVAAANPGVVYVSISGYGQESPWSGRPAFAPTVQAESGMTTSSLAHYGQKLTEPAADAGSHADLYTGYQGAIAALAGLNRRARTGRGTHADVSMMATMLAVNERAHAQLNEMDSYGEPLALSAPESPIFTLADGSMVTIAASPVWSGAFQRYCTMMGRNDLKLDPRFETAEKRRSNVDALLAEVQAWIHSFRSIEELEAQVSAGGRLAVGRLRSALDVLDTEWAQAAEPTYAVNVGEHAIKLPKAPWLFDGVDSGALPRAAAQGQHNRDVLLECGLDEQAIDALAKAGVLHGGAGAKA